jgi:uncharacterized heparinase superfamily protein
LALKNIATLTKLSLYWHTLRYLRFKQIYGRFWFHLVRPRIDRSPAPSLRKHCGAFYPCAKKAPSLVGPSDFIFLNTPGNLDILGWNGDQVDKLWRYNQHYFDDLNARDCDQRSAWHESLLLNWIKDNAPGIGIGWDPYPTSLRIVNWIKWAISAGNLNSACIDSLATQVRWLSKRLETHLMGNHLFANAKALIYAGIFFEGSESKDWLRAGLDILDKELREQILGDGGHFERSTMYHALALEDVLDLINILDCYKDFLSVNIFSYSPLLREQAGKMVFWLNAMRHPDGEISFFNDAAFGISPTSKELIAYAEKLGVNLGTCEANSSVALDTTGYVRLQTKTAVALLDIAEVGPSYIPSHAHADTLTFELSVFGQRLLVNSGTSLYGVGLERARQRGTSAHNTVVVSGENSSEVWGGFRVARRARPSIKKVDLKSMPYVVCCSHNGYARLQNNPIHERCWVMAENSLDIEDSISSGTSKSEAYFHFHPDVLLEICEGDPSKGRAKLPNGNNVRWDIALGKGRIESSTWHPKFGLEILNKRLVITLIGGKSKIRLGW